MITFQLPSGNGWTSRLVHLLLLGYVLLVFAVLVFVVLNIVREISHWLGHVYCCGQSGRKAMPPRILREIADAGSFRSDRDKDIPRPSRLTPEPPDIDRVSREHNAEWREALRERIEDDDAD